VNVEGSEESESARKEVGRATDCRAFARESKRPEFDPHLKEDKEDV
jgi:hypothetical protein